MQKRGLSKFSITLGLLIALLVIVGIMIGARLYFTLELADEISPTPARIMLVSSSVSIHSDENVLTLDIERLDQNGSMDGVTFIVEDLEGNELRVYAYKSIDYGEVASYRIGLGNLGNTMLYSLTAIPFYEGAVSKYVFSEQAVVYYFDSESVEIIDTPSNVVSQSNDQPVTQSSTGGGPSSSGSDSDGGTGSSSTPGDTTPPGPITSLRPLFANDSAITWNWTPPTDTDLDTLHVYVNGNEITLGGVITNYTVSGLEPSTSYAFGVETKDSSGNINTNRVVNVSRTLPYAGSPWVRITSLDDGQVVSSDNITLSFRTLGFSFGGKGADHVHVKLNSSGQAYMIYNGSDQSVEYGGVPAVNVSFINDSAVKIIDLPQGAYSLNVTLVDASHQFLGNSLASEFLTFSKDVGLTLACGNNVAQGSEACDGSDFREEDCSSLVGPSYIGTLLCSQDCLTIDTSSCVAELCIDNDGDGYGDPGVASCTAGSALDCDDTPGSGASVYPGATELCDGIDNDCDDVVDEGTCTTTDYLAYWDFNGDAIDESGNGHNGAISGATFTTGIEGQALDFGGYSEGTGDRVQIGRPPELQLEVYSISAWFKQDPSPSSWEDILGWGPHSYFISVRPQGRITYGEQNFPGNQANTTAGIFGDGQWHHVVMIDNGTALIAYIDGAYDSHRVDSFGYDFNNDLWLGGDSYYGEYFDGVIDEIKIWGYALDEFEVAALYNQFTPPQLSPLEEEPSLWSRFLDLFR